MSSKAYQEVYHLMTDKQKDIMYDLFMKSINYDGHVMNKFCDIEDAVAGIVKEQIASAKPDVPDISAGNMVSKEAVLDEIHKYMEERDYTIGELHDRVCEMPQAQPTLYGYDIKCLAFVASIMAKKGVSPEEAVTIFQDVNRVIEMMLEDMKEMQENALKQALKKPLEGGQDSDV